MAGLPAGQRSKSSASILSWTEEAERLLGNVFDADVVSDLVHTPRYWALRTSGEVPRLVALVLAEADRVNGANRNRGSMPRRGGARGVGEFELSP